MQNRNSTLQQYIQLKQNILIKRLDNQAAFNERIALAEKLKQIFFTFSEEQKYGFALKCIDDALGCLGPVLLHKTNHSFPAALKLSFELCNNAYEFLITHKQQFTEDSYNKAVNKELFRMENLAKMNPNTPTTSNHLKKIQSSAKIQAFIRGNNDREKYRINQREAGMHNRAAELAGWEEYNRGMGLGNNPGLQIGDCFYRLPKNYTDLFFDGLSLMHYANTECKRWVQFGASNGIFLAERRNEACAVVGYDYSQYATIQLHHQGISARQVDINNTDDQSNLSCQNQVSLDLMQPCNLLVIRLLEYLTPDAKILFLHLLIEKSQPGSVFFLSEATLKDPKGESSDHHSGYIKTFFTTRTDFEYLFFARTADQKNQDKLLLVNNLQEFHMNNPPKVDDHIMVFKKI